jgi:hypothetical protein
MGTTALDDIQKFLRLHRNVPQDFLNLPTHVFGEGPGRGSLQRRLGLRLGRDDNAPLLDLHPETRARRQAQGLEHVSGKD